MNNRTENLPESIDNNENLMDFLLSNLNEKSSFANIRTVAKIAIKNGMAKESNSKKNWIISSLENLEKLENVSIAMQTVILAAIEVIVLSRRISNLQSLGVFARNVEENNNHCWLLDGARLAISVYYPQLNIYYLRCPYSVFNLEDIKENLTKHESIWLVVGYEPGYHLTLLRAQLVNEKLIVHVFDSVGSKPYVFSSPTDSYDRPLHMLITDIKQTVLAKSETIKVFPRHRQRDYINCLSFLLSDLDSALRLFEKGENYFLTRMRKVKV